MASKALHGESAGVGPWGEMQHAALYCGSWVLKEPGTGEAACAAEPGPRRLSTLQECTLMKLNVLQEPVNKISTPLMNGGLSISLSPSLSTEKASHIAGGQRKQFKGHR